MSEKGIYTGVRPLKEALNSVSIGSSGGRSGRSISTVTTIQEQEYDKLCRWMEQYSSRLKLYKSGKVKVKEKPILATLEEMKRDLGISWGRLKVIARKNGDVGNAFHYKTDISEEQRKYLCENLGLSTGVTYVALESQYPFLSNVLEKK